MQINVRKLFSPPQTVDVRKQNPDSVEEFKEPKDLTVLIYSAGDNNLDRYFIPEHKALEKIRNKNINLVMQWDRGNYPVNKETPWQGCKRFHIEPSEDGKNFISSPLDDLGQIDMASPENLTDFIRWGMKHFPAKHFMVVIKDHGHAWDGIIDDDSHKNRMTLQGLNKALEDAEKETGFKPDILAFDACGMANTEVLAELKDRANFLAASEMVLYSPGFPYEEALVPFDKGVSQRDLAYNLVEGGKKRPENIDTFAAFDLSKVDGFTESLDTFAGEIIRDREDRDKIKEFARGDTTFPHNMDLPVLLEKITESPEIKSRELKEKALNVKKSLHEMMVNEYHNPSLSVGGLSISDKYSVFSEDFLNTEFAEGTSWPEALRVMADNPLSHALSEMVKIKHNIKHVF